MFREDRRMEQRRDVDLILNAYQDGLPGLVVADNLSASGIRIRRILGPVRELDRELTLEFQLPHDTAIYQVRALPVYERGGIVGLRFVEPDEDTFESIQAFVEEPVALPPIH